MCKQVAITSCEITNQDTQLTSISSVSLPDDRTPPKGLFTVYYGARDTLVALQENHIKAHHIGQKVKRVDMKVNAGNDPIIRMNEQSAQQAVFLNLAFIDKNFEKELINNVFPGMEEQSLVQIIDDTPDRLHDLFNYPGLPSLNVIVWPASYKKGEKLQMASIRDTSQISIRGEHTNAGLTIIS